MKQFWRRWAVGIALALLLSWGAGGERLLAQDQDGEEPPVAFLITLAGEPSAATYLRLAESQGRASATTAAQDQLARIESAQARLLAEPALADRPLLFATQRVHNGVALLLTPAQAAQAAGLPGVVDVQPLPSYEVALSRTIADLGIPALWERVYPDGMSGERVSIGIIDTGIDYLHTHFGGPGRGYSENNTTIISDAPGGVRFPTAKVVGGFDFVGDDYDGRATGNPIPSPNPDPMDCWGHGTHVAGIAGGYGTLTSGEVYPGPYHGELDLSQFSIGPGIAPLADLYALKIFGCSGVSQFVIPAIEWAVDPNGDGDFSDRLDVLNLSLGSSFGSTGDVSAQALDRAAAVGMVVVAAAGNAGETNYIVISPGVADGAISVAAATTANQGGVAGFSARGPRRPDSLLKPEVAAPGVSIRSASAGSGTGSIASSGTSMATPVVAGLAALLRQRHPTWHPNEIKALIMNTARPTLLANWTYPPQLYGPPRAGSGRVDPLAAAHAPVIAYDAQAPERVSLSFAPATVLDMHQEVRNLRIVNKSAVTQTYVAGYLSAIDLPGVHVDLLSEPTVILPPHASRTLPVRLSAQAGAMQNLPDPTLSRSGYFPRHFLTEEAGYLYLWPETIPLTGGGEEATFAVQARLSWQPGPERLHAAVTITPALGITSALTLSGMGLGYGDALIHPFAPSQGISPTLPITAGVTLTETLALSTQEGSWLAQGLLSLHLEMGEARVAIPLRLAEAGGGPVQVPVYATLRPASAMRAAQSHLDFGTEITGTRTLELVGEGLLSAGSLAASRFPTDTVSVVAALRLQHSSPDGGNSQGVVNQADLHYVGIASHLSAEWSPAAEGVPLPDSRIIFGLATHGEWSNPGSTVVSIFIDTDNDGQDDYHLYTTNVGSFLGIGANDEFFTVLEKLGGEGRTLTYFVNMVSAGDLYTGVFNNSLLLLGVDGRDLGLTAHNTDFSYTVITRSRDATTSEQIVDRSPRLYYDVARPGLTVTGNAIGDLPIFYDLPGASMDITTDWAALQTDPTPSLLLLHLHNERPFRAERVDLRFRWDYFLPVVGEIGGVGD